MTAISDRLLELLDKVHTALARNESPPQELLDALVTCWKTERPDDGSAIQLLIETIRTAQDEAQVAAAAARMRAMDERLSVETREVHKRADSAERADRYEDGTIYPVYFGTNRQPVNAERPRNGFTSRRSSNVIYGRCEVWIPRAHRFGGIGEPWYKRWRKLQFVSDRLKLENIVFLATDPFWIEIQKEVSQGDAPRSCLLYLHGYNVDFREAAIRAAQIGFDLKVSGVTAFYSWPSLGTIRGYLADTTAVMASENGIAEFLANFARNSSADVLHVVSHSMGNQGLLRALQRLAMDSALKDTVRFGQIFLAAPDVDRDVFLSLAQLYPQFSKRTTLYASDTDKAVAASAWVNNAPRAGYFNSRTPVFVAQQVDSIAVPDFDLDMIGHGYYAEAEALLNDMFLLMQNDAQPSKRPRLRRVDDYWEMGR